MARIIRKSELVTIHEARHRFDWADSPGSGFGFEVVNGRVSVNNPRAWRNYQLCLRNGHKSAGRYEPDGFVPSGQVIPQPVVDRGIEEWERSYREPALLECDCGEQVWLSHIMTNTCDKCGADYNLSGQRLAPRSQWGEETGESLTDILNYNYDINTPASDYAEVDY